MGMSIDKTWRYYLPLGIYSLCGRRIDTSNSYYFIFNDADICRKAGSAGSIDDVTVFNDKIVMHGVCLFFTNYEG